MMIFEFITVHDVQKWNLDPMPPQRARLAGGISIGCWILVLFLGRSADGVITRGASGLRDCPISLT
jgi:hypothetical protein